MRIKSFIASTVQEALKSVKREMGDASIILETRNIEEGDIKSMAGQTLVEVIAAENNGGQGAVQNSEQKKDQNEGQDLQEDRGNLNLQSPVQYPPDSFESDQNQSEQYSSITEYKSPPEDQMNNITLADHLHSNNLSDSAVSSLTDRLNDITDTADSGEARQVSKWRVGSTDENSIPHVNHDTKKNSGNSNLLSLPRYQTDSSQSDQNQSEQYLSVKEYKSLREDQKENITLADHLLKEDLVEMAGYSLDKISVPLFHFQHCDADYDDWPKQSRELFKQLRMQQVEDEHSRILINEVLCRLSKDEYDRMDLHCKMLREDIIHKIKISDLYVKNRDKCKTTVFLGAAGTGKTTTISKLASDAKKRSDKEIILISIRGNSAEKLRKTACIIGATLRTVTSHWDLRAIRDKYEGSSHIFVDTPGISYLDDNSLSELKRFLNELTNIETHLVVSATTRYADIINTINKFTVFPIHRLLFTRVDETCLYGTLFSVAMETQIPLSFITDGQEVPEDIRTVTAEMIANMVLHRIENQNPKKNCNSPKSERS